MTYQKNQKITPDELLSVIDFSPADNLEDLSTVLPWKSKMVGQQVRGLFNYQQTLDIIKKHSLLFGPMAIAASWQSAILDSVLRRIKASSRLAVGAPEIPMLSPT